MNLIEIEKLILSMEFNLQLSLSVNNNLEKIIYPWHRILNSKIFSPLLPRVALNCGRYDIYKKYQAIPLKIDKLIPTNLLATSVVESSQSKELDLNISNFINTLIPSSPNTAITKIKLEFIDQLIKKGYTENRLNYSLVSELIQRQDYYRVKQLLINGSDVTWPIITALIHNDIKALKLIFKYGRTDWHWDKIKRQFYDRVIRGEIRGIADIELKTILEIEMVLGEMAFPELEIIINDWNLEDTIETYFWKKDYSIAKFLYAKI